MYKFFVSLVTTIVFVSQTSAQQTSADVAMIAFDDVGDLLPTSGNQLDPLLASSLATPPTDVFIAAHGWNNGFSEARASYRKMMQVLAATAHDNNLLPASYRSLVIGVSWPSKAWSNDALE